ncbi:MAG: response regulator transcription factor [Candidatus Acidiferrum sp.]
MGETTTLKLSSQVRVYLLTENRLLRDTLARLLKKRSEINVVGVNHCSETVRHEIISLHCDVVLTDCFDNTASSTFLRDVLGQDSRVKVLLFGMNEDPNVFLKAVFLGICGYLLKDASAAEIVAAVRAAVRGEATCPPSLWMVLIQHLSTKRAEKFEPSHPQNADRKVLTPRQLQLLRLVANGLTNKEIAVNLNLSQFTVKNHIRRVMHQVEAASRYDAVKLVRASGQLITP